MDKRAWIRVCLAFVNGFIDSWSRRAVYVAGLGVVRLADAEQIAAGAAEELARFAPEGGDA